MKRTVFLSLCLVAVLGFGLSDAMAVGLGVYGGLSSGNSDWTTDDNYGSYDFKMDSGHTEAGLVLDTAVAKDRLFNYRLNLGYLKSTYKDDSGDKLELDGFAMTHSFGFGVLRTENVRLWLGPQLRFSYVTGSPKGGSDNYSQFGVGIAPVLGININLGPVVTLAVDGGYRFSSYFGTYDYTNYSYSGYSYSDTGSYTVSEQTPFVNVSLIFRMGDKY